MKKHSTFLYGVAFLFSAAPLAAQGWHASNDAGEHNGHGAWQSDGDGKTLSGTALFVKEARGHDAHPFQNFWNSVFHPDFKHGHRSSTTDNDDNSSNGGSVGGSGVGGSVSTTPEPETWALLATGLVALGGVVRRRVKS